MKYAADGSIKVIVLPAPATKTTGAYAPDGSKYAVKAS